MRLPAEARLYFNAYAHRIAELNDRLEHIEDIDVYT